VAIAAQAKDAAEQRSWFDKAIIERHRSDLNVSLITDQTVK